MASITDTAVRRPVATAMLYAIVVTVGLVGSLSLPVDLLPAVEYPRLSVNVTYPNVGPEEMETIITDPLENALSGIPNLERMTSFSQEGRSRVTMEFGGGVGLDEAANDVRSALDRLRDDLPVEADAPTIWKFDPDAQDIVSLAVRSERDLSATTRLLEREIARRFEQIPGVGAVTVAGGVYREIQVQLARDRLKAAGLAAAELRDALARENVQLPGGNVKDGVLDLYVRTLGEYASVDEIGATVVDVRAGQPIRVRDVAQVVDGYEDVTNLAEVDGVPVVRLEIQKQSGANTVQVAAAVRDEVDRVNAERSDLQLSVLSDQSLFIRQSIDNVRSSALYGGLLAVAVLYVFLRNRSTTAIIALAIPISIVATFGLLFFTGLTLNQMTFGGLALGIGLIVDNAIVVLENIVRQRQAGRGRMDAARVGTREVAGAVVAATLTTCVIFLPVVFMRTTSGQLFQALSLVVVFALGCSLLIALTLVPMLASRFLTVRPDDARTAGAAPASWLDRAFARLEHAYGRWLGAAVRHRRRVLAAAGAAVVLASLLVRYVPVELTPPMDANEIEVQLEMARGTSMAVAMRYLDELAGRVRAIVPEREYTSINTRMRGDNAELRIRLVDPGERTVDPSRLADRIRQDVAGRIPGAEIRVRAQSGLWMLRRLFSSGGGAEEVEVELRGYDLDRSVALANQMRLRMAEVPGVVEVRVTEREGRLEENLHFLRDRIYSLGLSVDQVGRAVQTSVGGSRAGYFREGGEQFPITVRLRPEDRQTAEDLSGVAVKTPDGQMIPVSTLVSRQRDRGPTTIRHIDGQRVQYITANLEDGVALGDAVGRIQAALADLPRPPGFSIVFGGAWREQQEARRDLVIAVVMALLLVYMVLAGQFERFVDPMVVMASVPVAVIGVAPTLLLTGTTINVQSVMGMVMLVGIVVNNAIVLVDYVNLKRRESDLDVEAAVLEAGRARLRPILMTTTTTVLALVPLALGWGAGAGLQAALARVVVGGLFASSLVTLFLIPAFYVEAAARTAAIQQAWRGRVATPQPSQY
ncbi:MAG: efflux RND transporter permease subunit [Vicinamibacterales bacterium]